MVGARADSQQATPAAAKEQLRLLLSDDRILDQKYDSNRAKTPVQILQEHCHKHEGELPMYTSVEAPSRHLAPSRAICRHLPSALRRGGRVAAAATAPAAPPPASAAAAPTIAAATIAASTVSAAPVASASLATSVASAALAAFPSSAFSSTVASSPFTTSVASAALAAASFAAAVATSQNFQTS